MNKYDTEIILNKKSSLTYIISKIPTGATVLEFGSATGYMTRYLNEEKQCEMYIIEIDEDAYTSASVYAKDGICCDIEKLEWISKFQGMQFDYITFSDVLEHLKEPEIILKKSMDFLKENGKILVSIPNIAHNAVLIDLYNNKFKYRETGIMDNTHIRFYTHNSMREMFYNCGLYVVDEDAIVFNLEYAGFENSEKDIPEDFWKELNEREYGFVNQFLFSLQKRANEENIEEVASFKDIRELETSLYYASLSKFQDFSEEKKLQSHLYLEKGSFSFEYTLENIEAGLFAFELFQNYCVIEEIKIKIETDEFEFKPIGGFEAAGGGTGFICDFPKYKLTLSSDKKLGKLKVSGKTRNIEQSELRHYLKGIIEDNKKESDLQQCEIERLNRVIEEKTDKIHKNGTEITRLNEVIEEKMSIIHKNGTEITRLNEVIEEKMSIIHKNGTEITRLNKVIEEKMNIIQELNIIIADKNN